MMNNHLKVGSGVLKEYIRQMNQIMDLAEKGNKNQLVALRLVSEKLKSSLQKLTEDQPKMKKYVNNPAQYNAIFQPYISLLNSTAAEIERLKT